MIHPLYSLPFEWHDLPIERIMITEGGVVVDVRPFNDDANRVEHATLSLLEADSIEFNVQGKLHLRNSTASR